jgi:ELWxxDGT repeat protein
LTNVNGTLFFTANISSSGFQLWKSDGTEAGTVLVKDISPGGINPSPGGLINDNGTLLFIVYAYPGRQLWKSVGTPDGTVLIKNFAGVTTSVASLTNVNGTAFFVVSDGVHGGELWKSDGTTDGTVMVKDIRPGSAGSDPFDLFNFNGTLFFTANDGVHGRELWKSDGTEAGTVLVKDINPGSGDGFAIFAGFAAVNGTLFFVGNDGTHGRQLWKTDGTEAGTVLVHVINRTGDAFLLGSRPELTDFNGTLFFVANSGGNHWGLWKSDGTEAGTVLVKDANGSNLTPVNGTLFFVNYTPGTGIELWQSDGTEAGTMLYQDIYPGPGSSFPDYLTNINGTLYFGADDGVHGHELWQVRAMDVAAPGGGPKSGGPPQAPFGVPGRGANTRPPVAGFLAAFAPSRFAVPSPPSSPAATAGPAPAGFEAPALGGKGVDAVFAGFGEENRGATFPGSRRARGSRTDIPLLNWELFDGLLEE